MQPRPKMFCVSSSWYLCLIYSDCDISWSFSLFSKHSFFRHDKILLLAKKGASCRRKTYLSLNNDSVLLHMLWA